MGTLQRVSIPALISLAWLVMMYGLVRDDVLPTFQRGREITRSASYERLAGQANSTRVTQMGIYFGEARIGQAVACVKKRGNELSIDAETLIDLRRAPAFESVSNLLGAMANGKIRFRALVLDGRLVNFRSTVSSPPGTAPMVSIDGTPLGGTLRLEIRQLGETRVTTVPFDERQFVHSVMAPTLAVGELAVGKKWLVKQLDQMTGSVAAVWAEVLRKETVTIGRRTYEAFVVNLSSGFFNLLVWVDPDGNVLKQQFLGFTFVREEPSPETLAEMMR